ncbi:DUF4124 domain-containing protein [Acinetobacter towneri]|uniref:DUF4124 domain-containing protein n=2 Tax=Acinetobacter towneri TaxID=202956 RepID=A0AB35LZU3_9GAMM|nr:DUF4124 domain-containing protein [Acinetobacter towneri]MDM1718826.1 DUF4124 domain-containing protein [Acinetobacter towneri]MDM1730982.1 DUF4124 domain-containing protein [Acinetobacter towneri]MDM1733693.1 DUF4124 domain-containing protein [Acinetobacter towneri]MDM1738981.1 DUF4124 domain-containing protein [Acinetobacter towneri]MDM1741510.1 DUF4124 domain-containing protein [Acinetobacter towneri]
MKTPMIRLSCLSASLILIFATSAVSAKQYYKWVDVNGSTHYTTTLPPKTAKKKGKVDTYGWRNSAPTVATPANPADNPAPTAANATNQQATPTANHPAGNPAMDQQQREANAALNQAQQERANPQVF